MPKWKNKIDISDLHSAYESNEVTIQYVANSVADRLRELPIYQSNYYLQTIVKDLEVIAYDEDCNADDYDCVLNTLYNWGDIDNRLWINTF